MSLSVAKPIPTSIRDNPANTQCCDNMVHGYLFVFVFVGDIHQEDTSNQLIVKARSI